MSNYGVNALSRRYMELDVSPQFNGFSGVEVVVDDNTTYFAGDDTGRIFTVQNPWGTQEQANNILAHIQGYQYQPYTATGALLDPAAELGDGVSLHGVYGGIYKMTRNFSSLMAAEISAPQDEEIDHEYPFEPRETRDITRKFTQVESELSLASNEIAAKVSQTGGDNSSFGWNLLSDHFSLFSGNTEVFRVDAAGATVKGVITATSGQIGGFTIGNNAIYNNIPDFANSGGVSNGVYLGTDGIRLGKNFTVNTAGTVSANNMTLTGTLNIGGTNITAAALRQGAQSAYTNGGTWSTGSGYGYNYNNATKSSGGSYPGYFKATVLACSTLSATNITTSGMRFGAYNCYVTTINGVRVMGLGS